MALAKFAAALFEVGATEPVVVYVAPAYLS
jgi:hypothetical protein